MITVIVIIFCLYASVFGDFGFTESQWWSLVVAGMMELFIEVCTGMLIYSWWQDRK